MRLWQGNLVYPPHMATAFKGGGKELIHDGICLGIVDETAWHYQYVGIIVLTDEVGYFGNPA